MEILIVFGCLYTSYRIFRKKGEHFFDKEPEGNRPNLYHYKSHNYDT